MVKRETKKRRGAADFYEKAARLKEARATAGMQNCLLTRKQQGSRPMVANEDEAHALQSPTGPMATLLLNEPRAIIAFAWPPFPTLRPWSPLSWKPPRPDAIHA